MLRHAGIQMKSLRPVLTLWRALPLGWARFRLRTVNPLAPAEFIRELVLNVNKWEN